MTRIKTTDEYIASLSGIAKNKIKQLRQIIKKAAPDANEIISYQMPAFRLKKILVYYSAHTNHVGIYCSMKTIVQKFKKELGNYETSKGTIKFPLNKPLPTGLITKIIKFRVEENLAKR